MCTKQQMEITTFPDWICPLVTHCGARNTVEQQFDTMDHVMFSVNRCKESIYNLRYCIDWVSRRCCTIQCMYLMACITCNSLLIQTPRVVQLTTKAQHLVYVCAQLSASYVAHRAPNTCPSRLHELCTLEARWGCGHPQVFGRWPTSCISYQPSLVL